MDNLLKIYSNNELEINNIEEKITVMIKDLQDKRTKLEESNNQIKEQIKQQMEVNNIKKYDNDYMSITYVAATQRVTVDSKKLKEKYNEIYNECSKVSDVKASIRIKVKENIEEQKVEMPF